MKISRWSFSHLSKRFLLVILAVVLLSIPANLIAAKVAADPTTPQWQHQGAVVIPTSTDSFASDSMRVSMSDLQSTGATEVELVIPIYQHGLHDCTFYTKDDSPSIASVAAATQTIHSLGMKSILKFHVEVDDGTWRNFIDATDKQCWFTNYQTVLLSYLQGTGVDGAVIATEMEYMFGTRYNPGEAPYVAALVAGLRAGFAGSLTYDANSGGELEMHDIDWNLFDYIGVSCYWDLGGNLSQDWNQVLIHDIDPVHVLYPNKTIACTETGYRSVANAHIRPWDYLMTGPIDYKEQAEDYEALFDMMQTRSYFSGVDFWNWRIDFNAQDVNETEFTPQKKLAQGIMTRYFTSQPAPVSQIAAAYPRYQAQLGAPIDNEMILAGFARQRDYQNGSLYWSENTGVHMVMGAIAQQYNALGGVAKFGLPTSDEQDVPGVYGARYNTFAGAAAIYWSPSTGAHAVYGLIYSKYLQLGGAANYGIPTIDESDVPGVPGARYNSFTGGKAIYWSGWTGAHTIYGAIYAKYTALGGSARGYGIPASDEQDVPGVPGARYNLMSTGGGIYWSPSTGANEVHGSIYQKYLQMGGPAAYGLPITDETSTPDRIGRFNHFTGGRSIYWTPTTDAHAIYGAIRMKWAALGWERSSLGYPTTDEFSIANGRQNNFQNGHSIYIDLHTGLITVK